MSKHNLLGSIALFGAMLAPGLGFSTNALADVERIVVTSANEIGPFRGIRYREIIGMMEGTAPGGAYAVPVTIAFPILAADYNGLAIVEVPNSTTVGRPTWPVAGEVFQVARLHIGDDYMFGNGYFFISAHWDKVAADILGNATIAALADGYEIIRDSAAIARDPSLAQLPAEVAPPRGADQLIAFGYSQTGGLLYGWFHQNRNTSEGAPTFDGALVAAQQGPNCPNLDLDENVPCSGPVSDGAKVIAVNLEGDAQRAGFDKRGETADYRMIEVAGVPHLPATLSDFRQAGLPTQNPVNASPVFRAALHNLRQWLEGTEPPPSIYVTMEEGPPETIRNTVYREAVRDADGNALGGVRLPHMPGVREGVGAPLGTYTGLDLAFTAPETNNFFFFSGTFTPFSREEIRARYPNREAYVAAVTAAAAAVVADRYILQEDADMYIAAAQAVQFWN